MPYSYIYEPRAIAEREHATQWYIDKSIDAGRNFQTAVSNKLKDICISPTLYRKNKRNFREAIISGFPYVLIYFIDPQRKTVIITSVFHTKRHPKEKYKRI